LKKKSKLLLGLIIVPIFFVIFHQSSKKDSDPDAIVGKWYTPENKSIVQIYKGLDNRYYGKITWLKVPDENGIPRKDINNLNKSFRETPMLGLFILKGLEYDGNGNWVEGTIYNPDKGKTYNTKIWIDTSGKLKIRVYIGISELGRTITWIKSKID
jgi:uncharacterized protein (DUF2147 family)